MKSATIYWNEEQTPKSVLFDDVYFSNDDAIAETQYVFIDGNRLTERFIHHAQKTMTIAETGFGSGLNFLVLCMVFQQFRQAYPSHPLQYLHFISVEKYPLSLVDLTAIHQKIIVSNPELTTLASQLQDRWVLVRQQLNCLFTNQIKLTVHFCDIQDYAVNLLSQHKLGYCSVDAWFFDGFAPQKNPDMWSADLFKKLFCVTASQGTFATFTAASEVRRNLITAGFSVQKRKGFARKREMLIGAKTT